MGKFIALALIIVAVMVAGGLALANFQAGVTSVSGDVQTELESLELGE